MQCMTEELVTSLGYFYPMGPGTDSECEGQAVLAGGLCSMHSAHKCGYREPCRPKQAAKMCSTASICSSVCHLPLSVHCAGSTLVRSRVSAVGSRPGATVVLMHAGVASNTGTVVVC
jgi:hypothetical protein